MTDGQGDAGARPLAGVVVVDCAEGVAAGVATRLLADLGARVVKVEPPGGDRLRWLGPFDGDPDPELGGLHLALNAGKESVVADLEDPSGERLLRGLLAGADALVESAGPGVMERRGLSYAALAAEHPALVYASQSPFGYDGPYSRWRSSEIVDYAMGGFMYFCGDPGRPPLLVHGHQGEIHAGLQLALGTMFALWHARQTGEGQQVEVSTFESLQSAQVWFTTAWQQEGVIWRRSGSTLVRCRDGWVHWQPSTPEVLILIGQPELMEEPRFQSDAGWRAAQPEVRELFALWAAERSVSEVYEAAQALRQRLAPVNTAADLGESAQLAARGWWKSVESPSAGRIAIPGAPWQMSRSPSGPQSAAPLLGSSSSTSVAASSRLRRSAGKSRLRVGAPADAVANLRVVEVTNAWAGPLVGRQLGDMGADVVAVERLTVQRTRADRTVGPTRNWPRFFDRGTSYNQLNRNKRGIALDLNAPQGREAFLELVRWADVVVENNSPRVFRNLGFDYPSLARLNPRLVLCSVSAFGGEGPESHHVAMGSNIEASSGLVAQTGYGPGELHGSGSFQADPLAGTAATLAVLAALWEREESGLGQHVDVSLQEAGALSMVEALMDYQLSGRVAGPHGNHSWRISPQGAYRAAGEDDWLAIGVEDDAQWSALCEVIGSPALAARYPDLEARQGAQSEIDAAIEAWSGRLDHLDATRRLQAAGVPAGPLLANWEICADPHLFARGYWVEGVHPEAGYERHDGFPWRLSSTPGRLRRPAPRFAEHNDEVLREVAGLSEERIRALRAAGAVADRPRDLHLYLETSGGEG